MALGRPNALSDLMSKYGVSSEDLVKRIFGDDEKSVKEGLKTLDLVCDYRNTNIDTVRKFCKATGATEEEVASAVADVELYKKEFKSDLDKEVQAQIDEVEKSIAARKEEIYAEYDAKVKKVIEDSVYGKGLEWSKEQEAKKAEKKKKPAKETTTVEAEAPVEEGGVADPFDQE